jgi:MFS family permease
MKNVHSLPFLMWVFPLLFFAYQFILRLWPSLMMEQIMSQFAIDATAFGLLASVYYYGYAGMQIPIAIAMERYGARLIVSVCALICGLAAFLFFFTTHWYLALFARFLIGVGSAVGFLGASKVISEWFPKEQYARMVGFTFTFGLLGAIYGGKPVSLLIASFGWQSIAMTLAIVAILIGILTYVFLREPNKTTEPHLQTGTQTVTFKDFQQLLRSPAIWLLALANLLMVGALEGFADVWGPNYLMAAYQFDKPKAAELTSLIFVGMLFGGPLLAFLARRFGSYLMLFVCGMGIAAALLHVLFAQNSPYMLVTLFFIIGLFCCYQVLVFSVGCDFFSVGLWGVTVAFLNCANMSGGAFFHLVIGFVMDSFWAGGISATGVREYTAEAYKYALLVIPACAMLGALIIGSVGLKLRKKIASEKREREEVIHDMKELRKGIDPHACLTLKEIQAMKEEGRRE